MIGGGVTANFDAGGAILVDCIVRLLVSGIEAYRHPTFDMGKFAVKEIDSETHHGYTHAVDIDGVEHACFKSFVKAMHWAEFMTGKRGKP